MSMPRDSVSENSTPGRWLRSLLSRISSQTPRLRKSPDQEPVCLQETRTSRFSPGNSTVHALLAPRNRLRIGIAGAVIIVGIGRPGHLRCVARLHCRSTTPFGWTALGHLATSKATILRALTDRLIENQIGTAFAYVSSLGIDNRWTGGLQGKVGFMDSRSALADFVRALKSQNEQLRDFSDGLKLWSHLDNVNRNRLQ